MTTKTVTIESIKNAAATLIAAASLPEPKTLEQVYDDPACESACVCYITVEDPTAVLSDELPDETTERLYEYMTSLYSCLVSDSFAYEETDFDELRRVARELSSQFENLVFAISSDYYEHGNPDEAVGGEFVEGYFNGKDVFDVTESDVK